MTSSHIVHQKEFQVQSARKEKQLAHWSYAPDFQVRYQKRVGGLPADSHIVGVELSIPLWFWGNRSRAATAGAREIAARSELSETQRKVQSDLRILRGQLRSEYELLQIFDTSLIPQSVTSYNSASSAYRASKISFVDYLDAERSLLKVEINRYRTLSRYVESLSRYEALLGERISELPTGGKS